MAKPLVSDELWELVEPLLPKVKRRYRYPGRKRLDDRKVLSGILFVLQTGIPWEYLPQEMGCGSGVTCWRRLRERRRTLEPAVRAHPCLHAEQAAAVQHDGAGGRHLVDSSSRVVPPSTAAARAGGLPAGGVARPER